MNEFEAQLRAAIQDGADEIGPASIAPFRVPASGPVRRILRGGPGSRSARSQRWLGRLAPLAAATAVVALAAGSIALASSAGHGRTPVAPGSAAAQALPAYSVGLAAASDGTAIPGAMTVRSVRIGRVTATVRPPAVGLAAAVQPGRLYLLRISPSGVVRQLTALGLPVFSGLSWTSSGALSWTAGPAKNQGIGLVGLLNTSTSGGDLDHSSFLFPSSGTCRGGFLVTPDGSRLITSVPSHGGDTSLPWKLAECTIHDGQVTVSNPGEVILYGNQAGTLNGAYWSSRDGQELIGSVSYGDAHGLYPSAFVAGVIRGDHMTPLPGSADVPYLDPFYQESAAW
jgi:hypothetical protein